MSRLAELIEETKAARELKRALSVKMVQSGIAAADTITYISQAFE